MERLDPRQEQSKQKIHYAYLSLVLKGNDKMTIQAICKEANITRPTFYKLYKDINELREGIYEVAYKTLKESITVSVPPEKIDYEISIQNTIELFYHIKENKRIYEVLLIKKPDAYFISNLMEVFSIYAEYGIQRAKFDEQKFRAPLPFLVNHASGAFLNIIIWWINDSFSYSPEQMAHMFMEVSTFGPFKLDEPIR